MIIVRLYGGLGNQLFQYATARRLSEKIGTELVLDIANLERVATNITTRHFELMHYPVSARLLSKDEKKIAKLFTDKFLKRLPLRKPWSSCKETHFHFDPRILNLGDNVYLDGYWQSYKYFEDIEKILRLELNSHKKMSVADKKVLEDINTTNSIAIHVRRGDYVSVESVAQTHGVCSLNYYRRAIDFVTHKVENPQFFIFSDDPEWVSEHLSTGYPTSYVIHNGPEEAFQDLRLMSLCQHQIIANSSFSWWGAWLNKNAEKIVIAPRRWFLDKRNTSDMCPENWNRI